MSAVVAGTVGVVGTILGGIVGSACTYFFSRRLFNDQRKAETAAVFREAFIDVMIICREHVALGCSSNIRKVMDTEIINHERAVLRFRPFVGRQELAGFDLAVSKHKEGHYDCGYYIKMKPTPRIGEADSANFTEEEQRDLIYHGINSLLKFA